MNLLLSAFVLIGAAWSAHRVAAGRCANRLTQTLAMATMAFAFSLFAFFLQGFVELVARRPVIGVLGAALIVAFLLFATSFASRPMPKPATLCVAARGRIRPIVRIAVILVVGSFILLSLLLLINVPRGYEVHAYHLPIAVRILRDGTLGLWDGAFMHAYPANMSIWSGLFLNCLPERWVSIVNLPLYLLLCAAVYSLSLACGADRSASLLTTVGLATVPIFGFSALELGADIGGVAFVAVATLMIVTPAASRNARAALGGVAAGLAFGFKSLQLVPIAVLGLFIAADCARAWMRTRSVRAFTPAMIYAAAALGPMSFWLIRNLVEAGNPLYPVHLGRVFDLFGWRAAPDFDLATRSDNQLEWVGSSRGWLVYPWVEGHVIQQNFKHSSGLGPFVAATVPIVAVLWPVRFLVAVRSASLTATSWIQAKVFMMAAIVVIAWWVLGDRQPRYLMTAVAMMVPIAASFVTGTVGRVRNLYEAMLTIGIGLMACVLLTRLAIENGPLLLQQRGASRAQALQYAPAIDQLPAGSVVANGIDREVSYSLLGEGLHNHVVDAAEIDHRFSLQDNTLRLTRSDVEALGITHLYVLEDRKVETDDCIDLREIERFDKNPLNGQHLTVARILFSVGRTCR